MILLLACSQSNLVESVKDDAVVAVINSNEITINDLRNEMNLLMRQFRVTDLNELTREEKLILKTNGLNRIIHNILLNMEVDSNRIFLTPKEYNDALNKAKSEYGGGSFAKYLDVEGISLEVWENKFKNNLLVKKLIREVVNSKVSVSDEQIKRYYDSHPLEFQKSAQVRSLHIMVESENKVKDILKVFNGKRFYTLTDFIINFF